MAKILISDLPSVGLGLFSDSESFLDSMQGLSENELRMTFGGKKYGSKSKSKKSKSSYGYKAVPVCPPVHAPIPGGGPN